MDVGTLGAISTVLVTIAFFGVCFWAFSPKLKNRFDDDANLPFADETKNKQTEDHQANDDQEGRN
ncbi:MAG: cbb3-type cytochrome c oxidase subunit 3 [Gammaproteobacteria bacterium]|nr:MAG: cbb3-type cytochrome c oxidase subunit 3 [Gammaproteobacteria bacterium]